MSFHFEQEDAVRYGVDEAIFINTIRFWLRKNVAANRNFYEGRHWTFMSQEGFQKYFPFWSRRQIQRILKSLASQGVLIEGNFNKSAYDKTIWYTFDDQSLINANALNGAIEKRKRCNRKTQTVQPIPDNNPDNKTDNNKKGSKLVIPTLEEVKSYAEGMKANGINIYLDPAQWWHRMDAEGWQYKGKVVKNWKRTYLNWNQNQLKYAKADASLTVKEESEEKNYMENYWGMQ